MTRAADLHRAIAAFDGDLDAMRAGRVLRALSSFFWYEVRHRCADQRASMHQHRKNTRKWQRAVLESDAFARCYAALPEPKLANARELLKRLSTLRTMIQKHRDGGLDAHAHASMLDHEKNLVELRALSMRFPDRQRAWIDEAADRIEADTTRYADPFADAAPMDLLGTRGRAGDPASAFRGWMTRSVAELVPESTHNPNACIATLLTLSGLPFKPDQVRATLDAWNRKRGS